MLLRPFPRIETERLILRLPELDDVNEIIKYFIENKAHFAPFDPSKPEAFYTKEFWQDQVPRHVDGFLQDKEVRLFLFDKKNNKEVIGSLAFTQIARGPFQACYLGYGISLKNQAQNLMYEAVSASIEYAFNDLNIHRIMANHLPENGRSANLLKRLGFKTECIAKDYLKINGKWRDHVLNSLINVNWKDTTS